MKLFAIILTAAITIAASAQTAGRNVVIVTLDGFRWQEMFTGVDSAYFKKDANGQPGEMEKRYWRPTPQERRVALMPFVWNTVASQGQMFGDPAAQSRSHVTNGLWFSYPGYNEMFSGAADPRIDSNNKVPNPNTTVLEWLNTRPGFQGRVAAFGSWDVLPSILNAGRSRIPIGTSFTPVPAARTERERDINQLAADLPPLWSYGPLDAPMLYAALEALRTSKPRVLYVMLGETDEFAHQNNYDMYVSAASRADSFLERVWNTLQTLPDYKGQTTLLVTTDHGRGATTADWKNHGKDVPAAENTWIAAMGPAVAPLGIRSGMTVTTAQVAATIAASVGENFPQAYPRAAPPLPGIGRVGR